MTSRIHIDASLLQRLLCWLGLHDWARWERLIAELIEGRTKRQVVVQLRECTGCGLAQRKLL